MTLRIRAPGRYLPLIYIFIIATLFDVAGCGDNSARNTLENNEISPQLELYRGVSATAVRAAGATVQRALETLLSRQSKFWSAGDAYGSVTPIRTYKTVENVYCREYVEVVTTKQFGRREARRIACRDRDELWKRVRR